MNKYAVLCLQADATWAWCGFEAGLFTFGHAGELILWRTASAVHPLCAFAAGEWRRIRQRSDPIPVDPQPPVK